VSKRLSYDFAMGHSAPLERIRLVLGFFLVALVASGVTAFPLVWEINLLCSWFGIPEGAKPEDFTGLQHWLALVRHALVETDAKYPFLAYGTDWLAFGHLMIAVFVFGAWLDPMRNLYVIHAAMVACLAVVPLALICGPIRGIPFYWQLIDCSFGVLGILPLLYVKRLLRGSV
jgi:hypothetical protein